MGSNERVYADWDSHRVARETTASDPDTYARPTDIVLHLTHLRVIVHREQYPPRRARITGWRGTRRVEIAGDDMPLADHNRPAVQPLIHPNPVGARLPLLEHPLFRHSVAFHHALPSATHIF
jgi:hypothetical protein